MSSEEYRAAIGVAKKHIVRGDIIQAVPSQRFARPTDLHPFNIYRHLRTVNPSPYLFFVDCADFQIVGASPELLVKSEAGRIITHPIAGTVKRGATPEEDQRLADELPSSLKDRAEHVMLVDLARNDVTRVCDPLETRVDRLMVVEKFSHVQHLVSQVSGVLRPGMTRFDAFRSIFPAGTVSGAPKVKAMELIAELEGEKRGIYAGAVGYIDFSGNIDTAIAIRTMVVSPDGRAHVQAGAGIVADSDPEPRGRGVRPEGAGAAGGGGSGPGHDRRPHTGRGQRRRRPASERRDERSRRRGRPGRRPAPRRRRLPAPARRLFRPGR